MRSENFPVSGRLEEFVDNLLGGKVYEDKLLYNPTPNDDSEPFPAKAYILGRSNDIEVTMIKDEVEDLYLEFASGELGFDELKKIYVMTGVVRAAMQSLVNPVNVERVDYVYNSFRSPDGLLGSILDSNIPENDANYLMLAIREGWIAPDLSVLNTSRMALTLLYNSTEHNMKPELDEFSDMASIQFKTKIGPGRESFTACSSGFGVTPEISAIQFAEEIPYSMLIGAFPAKKEEANRLIDSFCM